MKISVFLIIFTVVALGLWSRGAKATANTMQFLLKYPENYELGEDVNLDRHAGPDPDKCETIRDNDEAVAETFPLKSIIYALSEDTIYNTGTSPTPWAILLWKTIDCGKDGYWIDYSTEADVGKLVKPAPADLIIFLEDSLGMKRPVRGYDLDNVQIYDVESNNIVNIQSFADNFVSYIVLPFPSAVVETVEAARNKLIRAQAQYFYQVGDKDENSRKIFSVWHDGKLTAPQNFPESMFNV